MLYEKTPPMRGFCFDEHNEIGYNRGITDLFRINFEKRMTVSSSLWIGTQKPVYLLKGKPVFIFIVYLLVLAQVRI